MALAQEQYYEASLQPEVVHLGLNHYLAIEGQGPPGAADYQARISTLMAVAAAGLGPAAKSIQALETIYWSRAKAPLNKVPPEEWQWRHLVRVPYPLDKAGVKKAQQNAGADAQLAAKVHPHKLNEGACVQALHVGPYEGLPSTYAKLLAYIGDEGYRQAGRVHEIYLDEPTTVAPTQLRTICRIPIQEI